MRNISGYTRGGCKREVIESGFIVWFWGGEGGGQVEQAHACIAGARLHGAAVKNCNTVAIGYRINNHQRLLCFGQAS
jgi:hypothetical protein